MVIHDGETEWAFFVGTIGKDYWELDKDLRKTLDYMAAKQGAGRAGCLAGRGSRGK